MWIFVDFYVLLWKIRHKIRHIVTEICLNTASLPSLRSDGVDGIGIYHRPS